MTRRFTVIFITLLAFVVLTSAADKKIMKPMAGKLLKNVKVKMVSPEKPLFPFADDTQNSLCKTNGVRKTMAAHHLQVGTSGNGYGWLMSAARSLGRYNGLDIADDPPVNEIDYLLVGFRGHGTGNADMAAAEIDVDAGLANGTLWVWEEGGAIGEALNGSIDPYGSGARYPCVVALERPVVCFNQYVADVTVPTDPPRSHPYLVTEYMTYGPNGGAWTTPDYLMDAGWINPTVATMPTAENRLWNGPVTVVKDASGIYRYLAVYETWYSDAEQQIYGVGNDKHIITAKSVSTDLSSGWIKSWEDTPASNPVWIDTNLVQLYRQGVDMNSSGFGVIAGMGHLGHSDPLKDYYYAHTRITYSITTDFGLTWSPWDTVGLHEDLGLPNYIYASEKLFYTEIIPPADTVWYDGPAFLGNNFDISVMVDDENGINVAFTSMWGGTSETGWYPSYKHSGIFYIRSTNNGVNWGGGHITYLNGIWEGDEEPGSYLYDNEAQVSKDEVGNVYVAWLDRRHTGVQTSQFLKYTDPDDYPDATPDYKTDIFAAHSIDGGYYWSSPINLSDTPSSDEYELNMALRSKNQTAAIEGDYGKIWLAYVLADTLGHNPANDAMIEMSNAVWVVEGTGFNEAPNDIGEGNVTTIKSFALRQNYPNPFNPTTKIAFTAAKNGQAKLTVYNINGQEISILFNGHVNKGASYEFDFDGSNLSAGIYFYRLQSGSHMQVKKMALIK